MNICECASLCVCVSVNHRLTQTCRQTTFQTISGTGALPCSQCWVLTQRLSHSWVLLVGTETECTGCTFGNNPEHDLTSASLFFPPFATQCCLLHQFSITIPLSTCGDVTLIWYCTPYFLILPPLLSVTHFTVSHVTDSCSCKCFRRPLLQLCGFVKIWPSLQPPLLSGLQAFPWQQASSQAKKRHHDHLEGLRLHSLCKQRWTCSNLFWSRIKVNRKKPYTAISTAKPFKSWWFWTSCLISIHC